MIDSIQTLYSEQLQSAPGSVAQVRECAAQLTRLAKQSGLTLIMIGHVTKEGSLAGPRVLEHMVDTVLYFEGDTHSSFRLVRAFKNRFGAVNELGVFAMTDRGLKGVANPSALFLSQHDVQVAGSCVMVTQEGTRPLLVEIQALVDAAHVPNPRRLSVGLDQQRLAMLLAVLHRHAGIAAFDQDVFVNAVGGVRITEPAADLAVLLAIVSSMRDKPMPRGLVAFGEVGLAGEIRPAPRGQERLREAAKLGFSMALIPRAECAEAVDRRARSDCGRSGGARAGSAWMAERRASCMRQMSQRAAALPAAHGGFQRRGILGLGPVASQSEARPRSSLAGRCRWGRRPAWRAAPQSHAHRAARGKPRSSVSCCATAWQTSSSDSASCGPLRTDDRGEHAVVAAIERAAVEDPLPVAAFGADRRAAR